MYNRGLGQAELLLGVEGDAWKQIFRNINVFVPSVAFGNVWPKFWFKIRRDNGKNFLWAPSLWVGRRQEPILGFISKFGINRIREQKG